MDIHLLDVGQTKYGDCILIQRNGRSILIDGAHPGDTNRIRTQLKTLFGHAPPFKVDLLIVTHCHSDHIGCLPALVTGGDLGAEVAVVADELYGFGRSGGDGAAPVDALGLSDERQALVTALQEEDHSDLPDAELNQFLQDAATLEANYVGMLDALKEAGTRVLRFGRDAAAEIEQVAEAFADFGLKFLGPTVAHLQKCAQVLAQDALEIGQQLTQDAQLSDAAPSELVQAYRSRVKNLPGAADDPEFAQDRPGPGAAKNDQSIVLTVEADGWRALLAGDMQFAKAEVPGLTPIMRSLRTVVQGAGPYDFVKFSHHTSYNGVSDSVIEDFGGAKLFAHTGGLHDPDHPDPSVLQMIKRRRNGFTFARTDHNGMIAVAKRNGVLAMTPTKGRLNDFTPNPRPDAGKLPSGGSPTVVTPTVAQGGAGATSGADYVAVTMHVPHRQTRVTVTVDVEPGGQAVVSQPVAHEQSGGGGGGALVDRTVTGPAVGGGRAIGRVLFVTNGAKLRANIGRAEADAVLASVGKATGAELLDLPEGTSSAEAAADLVRLRLKAGVAGVVLIGGYDVVPANRLDVLDEDLRKAVADAGAGGQDADDFMVWSDDLYGDTDGDHIPELPVTRIPDGRRADVVFGALAAPSFSNGARFGVHNLNRPFALDVFPLVPGKADARLEVSEVFSPQDMPEGAAAGAVYFMLHGSARDGARFWGETKDQSPCEAVAVENVPAAARGSVVFSGCCWGALAMSPPALQARPNVPLRPRSPESSIAIAYLKAGALAFVGCTGSHYSPLAKPYNFFGKPMHDAFWNRIRGGVAPAPALFDAKREFAAGMPHGRTDPFSQAVEVKLLRQFTCLGLGW